MHILISIFYVRFQYTIYQVLYAIVDMEKYALLVNYKCLFFFFADHHHRKLSGLCSGW